MLRPLSALNLLCASISLVNAFRPASSETTSSISIRPNEAKTVTLTRTHTVCPCDSDIDGFPVTSSSSYSKPDWSTSSVTFDTSNHGHSHTSGSWTLDPVLSESSTTTMFGSFSGDISSTFTTRRGSLTSETVQTTTTTHGMSTDVISTSTTRHFATFTNSTTTVPVTTTTVLTTTTMTSTTHGGITTTGANTTTTIPANATTTFAANTTTSFAANTTSTLTTTSLAVNTTSALFTNTTTPTTTTMTTTTEVTTTTATTTIPTACGVVGAIPTFFITVEESQYTFESGTHMSLSLNNDDGAGNLIPVFPAPSEVAVPFSLDEECHLYAPDYSESAWIAYTGLSILPVQSFYFASEFNFNPSSMYELTCSLDDGILNCFAVDNPARNMFDICANDPDNIYPVIGSTTTCSDFPAIFGYEIIG